MIPYFPSRFGKYVNRLDFKETMSVALAMSSEQRRGKPRQRVRGGLNRMRVFAVHGCKCSKCGLEGTEIILTEDRGGGKHVDLYAIKDNEYVLMTRDHILPGSKGGHNNLWNLRPMCSSCNTRRGNEYTDADKDLYEHRERWVRWSKFFFTKTPWLSDRTIYRIADRLARIKFLVDFL